MHILTEREKKFRYGKPWRTLLYFCIPTVLIMVIQGFYNIIDKTLALEFAAGDLSHDPFYIALYREMHPGEPIVFIPLDQMKIFINVATQYATQTYNLLFAFAVMAGMGCAMNFSIAFGQRNDKKMHEIAGNGFSFTVIFSIFISFLVFCVIYPGFNSVFIRAQMGDVYNPITNYLAWEYSYPMLLAAPLMFLSYYFVSLLRSEGRMAWIILIMVSSLLINSGAAIFFMKVTHLKMEGAMLGTVFSWLVQVIWGVVIIFQFKSSYSRFGWKDLVLKGNNVWLFFKMGLPNFIAGASFVIVSFVSTAVVVSLPNQPHNNNISLLQELMSSVSPWTGLIFSAGTGISQAARAIIAYNFGAQKYNRIWQIIKRSSILTIGWFTFVIIAIIAFGDQMMLMFAFPQEYVEQYRWWLVLAFSSYPFAATSLIAFTLYQGINKSLLASFTNSLRAITIALPMIGLGYLVATLTGNSIFFFVFYGLIDLVSSLIIIPILIHSWTKYKNKLIDAPDDFKVETKKGESVAGTKQSIAKKSHLKKAKVKLNLKSKKHS